MTLQKACSLAKRIARAKRDERYVVYEDGEYEVATEFDLDTYYAGIPAQDVVCMYLPDGECYTQ